MWVDAIELRGKPRHVLHGHHGWFRWLLLALLLMAAATSIVLHQAALSQRGHPSLTSSTGTASSPQASPAAFPPLATQPSSTLTVEPSTTSNTNAVTGANAMNNTNSITKVIVNGQSIPAPTNGSVHKVITSPDGSLTHVDINTTNTASASQSSTNVNVQTYSSSSSSSDQSLSP